MGLLDELRLAWEVNREAQDAYREEIWFGKRAWRSAAVIGAITIAAALGILLLADLPSQIPSGVFLGLTLAAVNGCMLLPAVFRTGSLAQRRHSLGGPVRTGLLISVASGEALVLAVAAVLWIVWAVHWRASAPWTTGNVPLLTLLAAFTVVLAWFPIARIAGARWEARSERMAGGSGAG